MKVINLLPKSNLQDLRYEIIFHSLVRFSVITVFSFVLVFLSLFGTRLYVQRQGSQIDADTQKIKNFANKQENTQLRNQVKAVNTTISDFQNLADSTPRWSKVVAAFVPLVPQDVKIQGFTADLKTKKIQIIGYSPTREGVIDLYNKITHDSKNFYNVDYPLENVSKPENISFHYSFSIKDELLK